MSLVPPPGPSTPAATVDTESTGAPYVHSMVRLNLLATVCTLSVLTVQVGLNAAHWTAAFHPLAMFAAAVSAVPLALATSALAAAVMGRRPRFWVQHASLEHRAVIPMGLSDAADAVRRRGLGALFTVVNTEQTATRVVMELAHGPAAGHGLVDTAATLAVTVQVTLTWGADGTHAQVVAAFDEVMVVTSARPELLEALVRYLVMQAPDPVVRAPPLLLQCGLVLFVMSPALVLLDGEGGLGAGAAVTWLASSMVLTTIGLAVVVSQRYAVGGASGVLAWMGGLAAIMVALVA